MAGRPKLDLLLAAASAAFCLATGEAFVRLALRARFEIPTDERSLAYRYDAELGWFPREGEARTFVGSRTIHVRHNAAGFRDAEHGAKTRPRLALLGDSFVWGYDAEAEERFGERLQARLPAWEVLNLGVSGYGTDQEYLLARRVLPDLRPDVVVLFFSLNDSRDNRTNFRYGAYYKPYFERDETGRLALRGVPVPRSLAYRFAQHPWLFKSYLARGAASLLFRPAPERRVPDVTRDLLLAVRDLARSTGARFAVAFVQREPGFQAFCVESGIPFLDLSAAEQYPEVGHWTPAGHVAVAEALQRFLASEGWLAAGGDAPAATAR
jgi:lysophospholipase L1-like esterase